MCRVKLLTVADRYTTLKVKKNMHPLSITLHISQIRIYRGLASYGME